MCDPSLEPAAADGKSIRKDSCLVVDVDTFPEYTCTVPGVRRGVKPHRQENLHVVSAYHLLPPPGPPRRRPSRRPNSARKPSSRSPRPAPCWRVAQLPLQTLRSELDPAGLIVESTSAREGGGRFRLIPVRPDKAATPELLPPGTVRLYVVAAGGCELIYHGPHITDAD